MEDQRSRGYTSIHERRLELIERTMMGPRPAARPAERPADDETIEIDSVAGLIAGLVGIAVHGVSAMFPFLLAAFAAPLWFLVTQYAFWAGGMALAVRLRSRHPWLTLLIPMISIAAWVVAVTLGVSQLGWPGLRF